MTDRYKEFDEFSQAYFECALWASTDDTNPNYGGKPLDGNYGVGDFDDDTRKAMLADCAEFQKQNREWITDDNCTSSMDYGCDARAGHDFWLTRNHHGAGFWDGDWETEAGEKLTESARRFGEYDITASGEPDSQVSSM